MVVLCAQEQIAAKRQKMDKPPTVSTRTPSDSEIPAAQADPPSTQTSSSQEFDDGSIRESLRNAAGGQPFGDEKMDESDEKLGGDEKMDESDEMDESDGDDEGGEKNEAAAAAAASEGQDQDRQPNSWSGDTLQKESGATFSLTHNQWVTEAVDAEKDGRCEELLRSQVGAPITVGNVEDVNKLFLQVATQIPKDDRALSPAEKTVQIRLKDGVQGFEAKSYLGNLFREFLKNTGGAGEVQELCHEDGPANVPQRVGQRAAAGV